MGQNRIYSGEVRPVHAASWWSEIGDLLWPDIEVQKRIKAKAKAIYEADIDTCVNFGLHTRFDFSDYFYSYHGYLNQVCEELHKYGIRFIDHYSCNVVERPKDEQELFTLHKNHRHHVLLHKDFQAAENACYEGHRFWDICEVDLRDGSRGYTPGYQGELFCHNNPAFLDMHKKYLKRLVKEVNFDAVEVDDMCIYAYFADCGCEYCRERFRRDYGREIPPLDDKDFWGDTSENPFYWGNYDNPAFRDYVRMRTDGIREHIAMIKECVAPKPLLTCCSSTGPLYLNSLALDLEKSEDILDLVMLENCGITCSAVNWIRNDAEAMQQKDIAEKMGHAPAIALSYTVYEDGAYLGWALARFWGAANWSSTLPGRLMEIPDDQKTTEALVGPLNVWEKKHSLIVPLDCKDILNVRIVSNRYNRENGITKNGKDVWSRITAWTDGFVRNNLSYRFVRYRELADADALKSEITPIVMDCNACVTDKQHTAVKEFLKTGGKLIIAALYGTKDEKGFDRPTSLLDELKAGNYPGLVLAGGAEEIPELLEKGILTPAVKIIKGDARRVCRARMIEGRLAVHILNTNLTAVAHERVTTVGDVPVLKNILSDSSDDEFVMEVTGENLPELRDCKLKSPELGDHHREIRVEKIRGGWRLSFSVKDIKIYAIAE